MDKYITYLDLKDENNLNNFNKNTIATLLDIFNTLLVDKKTIFVQFSNLAIFGKASKLAIFAKWSKSFNF